MPRLLVIDDEPDQVRLRRLLLERNGFEVRTAGSPADALKELHDFTPDAILTDLHLPDAHSGLALIRAMGERSTAPILLVTGWDAELDGRPEAALVRGVIAKPYSTQELVGRIRAVL